MKVRIEKDALAAVVAWAARMLPAKAPMPVLSGIKLSATSDGVMAGGSLAFEVFDYEVSGRTSAAAEVLEPGEVLISGRQFAEIIKSLPARPIEMVTDGSRLRVVCGSSKFTLLTMPLDDYPTLPKMPAGSGLVSADVFAQAVAQVAVAASREDTPPMLAGVKVQVAGDVMTMIATDRYRLAVKEFAWRPSGADASAGALVRARTLTEVAKTLTPGGDVTIGLDGDMVGFESSGRRSTSLLMDGEYPRAMGLFPSKTAGTAVVNVAELEEAIRRVSLVAERNTAIHLAFDDGTLTLSAGQGEDAQAVESLPAVTQVDALTMGFNPQYLLDGLAALPHQYVRVTFSAASGEGEGEVPPSRKPVVLTGQAAEDGENDPSYRYLLMPMRL